MNNAPAQRKVKTASAALLHLVGQAGLRTYAVALIGVVIWLTWQAFRYLVVSLMFAAPPPVQITELPVRLDAALLEKGRTAFAGIDAVQHARSPLAHFHRLEGWTHPDQFNNCTTSGCHGPLPHSKRKEVRAFLNMHATSMHCGTCHMRSEDRPLHLTWYDLDTGVACDSPSILQVYDLLTSPLKRQALQTPTETDQRQIVALLRAAAEQADGLPALEQLAEHFAAVRAASDAFQSLIEVARSTLPRHFRGEYGAKLALNNPQDGSPYLSHPDTEAAVRRYQQRSDSITTAERAALLAAVHPLRRTESLSCGDCHRAAGSLVDFSRLGYPQARIRSITSSIVSQMIQHISEGRPWNIPNLDD